MSVVFILLLSPFFVWAGDDPDFPINQMITMDGYMGVRPVPNGVGVSNYFKPPLEYKLNSRGFRDDENNLKPKSIVALGASFTFGTGIRAEDRWSEQLENMLCDTEVRNISVAGYMIDQNYILLDEQIPDNQDANLVIYEPAHFNDNMMHLSQEGWGPGSRKPYLKFDQDQVQIVPADTPIPWTLDMPDQESLYRKFVVGYNKLLFDWFLFPKSEERSIEKAAKIFEATVNLTKSKGMKIIILIHQDQMEQALERAGLMDLTLDVRDVSKNYKVDKVVGHVNKTGNSIIAERIVGKLREMGIKDFFCN